VLGVVALTLAAVAGYAVRGGDSVIALPTSR